jgi:hypothetical protein
MQGRNVPARDPDRPQDDPYDSNAVRYLLSHPEVAAAWTRGKLVEYGREQRRLVVGDPDRVREAAQVFERYGVDRRHHNDGSTIHFFRTDPGAPSPYPSSEAERRAWRAH